MCALHDLSCVIHVHSTHSDGTGTVEQVARAGERAGVDVVLLTDHDSLGAVRAGEEGWYGSTLLVAGHEISPDLRNHLMAFGLDSEVDWRGLSARQIADAVRERGGFGIAAHPFSEGSERFWWLSSLGKSMRFEDLDAVDGVEVWSFVSDNGQELPSLRAALRFMTRPERYVTHPPRGNLDEWDRLCARRRVVGIGGLDAHQFGLRLPFGRAVRVMGYARTFRQLRTHLLVTKPPSGELEPDRALVFEALREGRCYIAAHPVAPARGFRFWAQRGDERVEMGAEAPAGEWTLRAALPARAEIVLVRDGAEVARAEGDELTHAVAEPGVYRVEAYRESHGARRTWILSNPVYLRA